VGVRDVISEVQLAAGLQGRSRLGRVASRERRGRRGKRFNCGRGVRPAIATELVIDV
jgi:hypothetical protein